MDAQPMHFSARDVRPPSGDVEEIGFEPVPGFSGACQQNLRRGLRQRWLHSQVPFLHRMLRRVGQHHNGGTPGFLAPGK